MELYAQQEHNGIVLLAVNPFDSVETVRSYFDREKFTFMALRDNAETQANSLYRIRAYPTTYVIGKDGKIVDHAVGYNPDKIRKAVERAVEAK